MQLRVVRSLSSWKRFIAIGPAPNKSAKIRVFLKTGPGHRSPLTGSSTPIRNAIHAARMGTVARHPEEKSA